MTVCDATISALSCEDWQQRAARHRERAERHTMPARRRRDAGHPHPIEDFLFRYYPFPFALLEQWQPGIGVALEISHPAALPPPFGSRFYKVVDGWCLADPALLSDKERQRFRWIRDLLVATQSRPGNFACHGLHEWAMVYRGTEVRHEGTAKLRLPQDEIDAFVDSRSICCSHHDAFRFFAKEARPMNRLQPDLDSRILLEQPGCVHANMDLYKWAAKSMPWCGSEFLLDCFELAMKLRELDMRASPYDLVEWNCEPVRIETPDGRREYETLQRDLAATAFPLRQRLIDTLSVVIHPD